MNAALPYPTASLRLLLWPAPAADTTEVLSVQGLELCFNARGALLAAFREISARSGRRRVLLPAYHCPSAVTPALMAGLVPSYYRVGRDLQPDIADLMELAGDDVAAVLIIRFFGLPVDMSALTPLRHRGIMIVEDCSHSFCLDSPLRLAGDPASDYRIFGFWKTLPCGVGGALLRLHAPPTRRAQARLSLRLRAYKRLAEAALVNSPNRTLAAAAASAEKLRLALRRPARTDNELETAAPQLERGEHHYPVDPCLAAAALPRFAMRAIAASDLGSIARRRRENFRRLADAMPRLTPMHALRNDPGEDTCPWVFPVLLEGRDGIDRSLREAGVPLHTFGIYLHSSLFDGRTSVRTVDEARYLAQRMLCLAIHQDLDATTMNRIADRAEYVLYQLTHTADDRSTGNRL